MTNKEKQILKILTQYPDISQNELARQLGISRSSVSIHILNLTKKGYIKGRGYIISNKSDVSVVGACNMDIFGFSNSEIILKDSNPGKLKFSPGGVGRNIAENLARMNVGVNLITTLGNDAFGEKIVKQCQAININCETIYQTNEISTSTYLAIMDNYGELVLALSHMEGIEALPLKHIEENISLINSSKVVVIDANLAPDLIHLICSRTKPVIFADGVSVSKVKRLIPALPFLHTIKLNATEAQSITGTQVTDSRSAKDAASYFIKKGVKVVAITLGKMGACIVTENEVIFENAPSLFVKNATGAGDAFMAGLVYSYLHNKNYLSTIKLAQGAANIALQSEQTVSSLMSVKLLKKYEVSNA